VPKEIVTKSWKAPGDTATNAVVQAGIFGGVGVVAGASSSASANYVMAAATTRKLEPNSALHLPQHHTTDTIQTCSRETITHVP